MESSLSHFRLRPLSETDIEAIVSNAGGIRAHLDADQRDKEGADFLLSEAVIELKALDDEGLAKPERQRKLADLFQKYESGRPVVVLDRDKLPFEGQRAYDRILEGPIKTAVSKANKQLKQSKAENSSTQCSILLMINNGYTALDHDNLVRMVAHRARNDTNDIDGVVIGGCYFYSDSFDSYFLWPLEYVPININRPFVSFDQLKSAWDEFTNSFMKAVVLGEIRGPEIKGPVVDTQFDIDGVTYVKPAPPMNIPSEIVKHRPRNEPNDANGIPPIATIFPEFSPQEWERFRDILDMPSSPLRTLDAWRDELSAASEAGSLLRPFVPIAVTREAFNLWCKDENHPKVYSSVIEFGTASFHQQFRAIATSARELTSESILPTRYLLAVTEQIGQDQANDVSHIYIIHEFPDSEPIADEILTDARLFHEYAIALASAYAVKHGIEFVMWEKDLEYAWI